MPPDHPRRNAGVTDRGRSRLIIDPGPAHRERHDQAARQRSIAAATGNYATTFPPPAARRTRSTRWAR